MKEISILGCGWLGLPLAAHLAYAGWNVKGSTTRLEKFSALYEKGIQPYQIQADEPIPSSDFFDSPILVINIPPRSKTRGPAHAQQQLNHILAHVKPSTWIVFISSTSVYPDTQDWVTEMDADLTHPLVALENQVRLHAPKSLILRCGGLMGGDRLPGKYVQGKVLEYNGQALINYIHQDDVVRAIQTSLGKPMAPGIYNLVSPIHPTRKEVMVLSCQRHGWPLPEFKQDGPTEPYKIVSGDAFCQSYDFTYTWPDPRTYV